jgi:hypothetical protein
LTKKTPEALKNWGTEKLKFWGGANLGQLRVSVFGQF